MDRRIAAVLAALGILAVLLPVLMIGCSQDTDAVEVFNVFSGADCTSPVLVSTESGSGNVVRLVFSEPVRIYGASLGQYPARAEGKNVYVSLPLTLGPGMQADLEGRVKDYAGNSSGFTVRVWGYNPAVPDILINEFTTKGTARSPDRTELLVLGDGNLNGAVLYAGVPADYDAKFVFGDIDVKKGDFITVWWTEDFPQGSSPGALDFCALCTDGLSSNNGALVLCRSPALGSTVLDAVLYSNFTASHEGYGTKTALERARWVIGAALWKGDAIDSSTSTSTRSMSRSLQATDTDSCADWYVTVTGGATFGSANDSEAY